MRARGLVVVGAVVFTGLFPVLGHGWQARADGPVGNWGRRHSPARHVVHRPAKPKVRKRRAAVKPKVAQVGITATAPGVPILPGKTYSWPYAVTNRSPVRAEQVVVTVPLPSSLHFVSAAQNCAMHGNAATCNLGVLKKGESKAGVITAQVDTAVKPGQSISSPATVRWRGSSAQTAFPTVRVAETADVAVTKSAPSLVHPGQAIPYLITVRNNGPSPAQTVVLRDQVQAPGQQGKELRPMTPADSECTASGNGLSMVCNLGTLAVGASKTLHARVVTGPKIKPGIVIQAPSQVSTTTTDTNLANNQATARTRIGRPGPALTIGRVKAGPALEVGCGRAGYGLTSGGKTWSGASVGGKAGSGSGAAGVGCGKARPGVSVGCSRAGAGTAIAGQSGSGAAAAGSGGAFGGKAGSAEAAGGKAGSGEAVGGQAGAGKAGSGSGAAGIGCGKARPGVSVGCSRAGAGMAIAGQTGAGAAVGGQAGAGSVTRGKAGAGSATGGKAGAGTMAGGQSSIGTAASGQAGVGEAAGGKAGSGTGLGAKAGSGSVSGGKAGTGSSSGDMAGSGAVSGGQGGSVAASGGTAGSDAVGGGKAGSGAAAGCAKGEAGMAGSCAGSGAGLVHHGWDCGIVRRGPYHHASRPGGSLGGGFHLPYTGAPIFALLNVVAAFVGAGLILHRIGRPRRRRASS